MRENNLHKQLDKAKGKLVLSNCKVEQVPGKRNTIMIVNPGGKNYELIAGTSNEFDEWLLTLQQSTKRDSKMDVGIFMKALQGVCKTLINIFIYSNHREI